jgi:hypothetical protein
MLLNADYKKFKNIVSGCATRIVILRAVKDNGTTHHFLRLHSERVSSKETI